MLQLGSTLHLICNRRERTDQFVYLRRAYENVVHEYSFGKIHEMGRREPSGPVSHPDEDGVDKRGYGAFTIGARDMNRRELMVRVSQSLKQIADVVETQLNTESLKG